MQVKEGNRGESCAQGSVGDLIKIVDIKKEVIVLRFGKSSRKYMVYLNDMFKKDVCAIDTIKQNKKLLSDSQVSYIAKLFLYEYKKVYGS
jgi:hypothetical protein